MARFGKRSAPTATTSTGPIRGTTTSDGRIAVFRGVPYAAPPVGDLRWQPPRSHDPWSDER
ncbi:MAG: carboxylesterase family protein, partial [Ilumatobacter sp.]|nr:carboxylesterase family protein [Ilumatobacter sp.]